MTTVKKIKVLYFALLREHKKNSEEDVQTSACSAEELFCELNEKEAFPVSQDIIKVAVNEEIVPWTTPLKDGDVVAFLMPVSGG